jgi:DNA-repair protein XRCC2
VGIEGPSGSGKTHLLYYLICSCVLPLRFGGWNKVSVVFDTDGVFDVHRLQTLLRARLSPSLCGEDIREQVISVALRNIHVFRPKSSPQLAAGLANLSSYHTRCLPTSEIALLAIDSARSFYWSDRLTAEQSHLMNIVTPPPTTSNNPHQTILTALWSFRRSHYPIIVILNWGPSLISMTSNVPALQLYKPFLPHRTSLFPDYSHATSPFLTHQITLTSTHVEPSSDRTAYEQGMVTLARHINIHVHVKTAVNHNELLHMQINPEQVIITTVDVANAVDSEEQSF